MYRYQERDQKMCSLRVANVLPEISPNDLLNLFRSFEAREVEIHFHISNFTGEALITVPEKLASDAMRCINGHSLGGQKLTVELKETW